MSANVVTLSHLLELRVEDEDGNSLGRVHDVRVRRVGTRSAAAQAQYEVEGLIVGRRGVLVRLGWRRAYDPAPLSPREVLRWTDVLAIEPDRLIVRRGAFDESGRS